MWEKDNVVCRYLLNLGVGYCISSIDVWACYAQKCVVVFLPFLIFIIIVINFNSLIFLLILVYALHRYLPKLFKHEQKKNQDLLAIVLWNLGKFSQTYYIILLQELSLITQKMLYFCHRLTQTVTQIDCFYSTFNNHASMSGQCQKLGCCV